MSPAQSPIRDASRMIARLSIQCQFYLCILEDIFSRYLDSTVYIQKTTKKTNEKGLTKLISLNSVRPFCWFHTYYLITTRFRINNAKISRVIILLSNRTLSALKCPVYKGFQKIFFTWTPLRTAFHDTQRLLLEVYISNVRSVFVFFAPLMKK